MSLSQPGDGAAAAFPSLQELPDPIICHMTSYLLHPELAQLSMLSRLMLQCSARHDNTCRLIVPKHRRWDVVETTKSDVLALRRRLSRAPGVCTHIQVEFGCMMELLHKAIHQEPELGRQVLTLEVGSGDYEPEGPAITLDDLTELLREGMFPSLRTLKVDLAEYTGIFDDEVQDFFLFLGEDACPQLEELELTSLSYAMLSWASGALNSRAAACEQIKALSLRMSLEHFDEDQTPEWGILAELLQAPCLSKLERLSLGEASYHSLALSLYVNDESSVQHLTELSLCATIGELGNEDGAELMLALAAGKAPNLRKLRCQGILFKGAELKALCEAIADGGALQHLEDLSIIGFESVDDAISCARAVGAGYPKLQAFKVDVRFQARALAALLRACPHVALVEDRLEIPDDLSLRELVEAVQQHHHGLPRLQGLSVRILWSSGRPLPYEQVAESEKQLEPEEAMPLLAGLLERCPAIGKLAMWRFHSGMLATALAPGGPAANGTRRLQELYVANTSDGVDGLDALLQSLVAGACPQLRSLLIVDHHQCDNPRKCNHVTTYELGSEAGQDALVALLSGQAPCSPTLRMLVIEGYRVDQKHTRQLTESFRSPKALCMELLGGLVFQGGLPAYIEFLHALSSPKTGRRLSQLFLQFSNLTPDGYALLDMAVSGLIHRGAWPCIPRDDVPIAFASMMIRRERTSKSMEDEDLYAPIATVEAFEQRRREREALKRRRSAEGLSTSKARLLGFTLPDRVQTK